MIKPEAINVFTVKKSDWAFNNNTMINSVNYWTHLPLEGRKRCPIPDEPLLVLSSVRPPDY